MSLQVVPTMKPVLLEVTQRIRERSHATRSAYLARVDALTTRMRGADPHGLRERRACLRRLAARRQVQDRRRARAQHRHRHRLQRHAVGAPAVRELPGADPRRSASPRRDGAGGGRRACDVRRRDAGPARHGTQPVLARRDRDGHGDRVDARCLRCRAAARRVRQDRARPPDRPRCISAICRACSCRRGRWRAACRTPPSPRCANSSRRAMWAARNC